MLIPTFTLFHYDLRTVVCTEIDQVIRKFTLLPILSEREIVDVSYIRLFVDTVHCFLSPHVRQKFLDGKWADTTATPLHEELLWVGKSTLSVPACPRGPNIFPQRFSAIIFYMQHSTCYICTKSTYTDCIAKRIAFTFCKISLLRFRGTSEIISTFTFRIAKCIAFTFCKISLLRFRGTSEIISTLTFCLLKIKNLNIKHFTHICILLLK